MLSGIDGHLLSGAFIDQQLTSCDDSGEPGRIHRALVDWRLACAMLGPASTPRALLQSAAPLFAMLGFDEVGQVEPVESAIAATLRSGDRVVALLVSRWADTRDALWRLAVVQAGRRSAAWCLIYNGLHLRVVDANRLYARRHVGIDLDLAVDDRQTTSVLVRLFAAATLAVPPEDPRSLQSLVAGSDRHAAGVCRSLREGVLGASSDILQALMANRLRISTRKSSGRISDVDDSFDQALTIVYRMLFLLFAEARSLVPLWHPIYRESYSLEALRDGAEQSPPLPGLWDALRAIARLAHAGCRAGDLHVTPFNGRLFAPARTPLADRRDLDDGAARRAILALSTRPASDRAGRERIVYRDLGVEQLGAVYETLLDYQPRIDGRSVSLRSGSGVRKATGTFYTPQPLADYLVRRTLGPLVREAAPEQILALRVVDPAMGSGAFLVAACRFLAAAYEAALVRSGGCDPSDFGEAERVGIRRTIAERCLYGVDLNPMAVQLARLSLWLATLAADRPLSFLDHRLQVGDSLLGAWVAHLGHAPVPRRRRESGDTLPLFDTEPLSGVLRDAMPIRFALEAPTDTVEQVREKERALADLTGRDAALSRWKRIAHLWCSTWFAATGTAAPASAFASLSDAALTGHGALPARTADRYLDEADAIAQARRLFHWELEFPEVFFDRDGVRRSDAGFDAVIGNPPWDMIRADHGTADVRSRERCDVASIVRFTREAGVYVAQSDGHANRYQLFTERAIALTKRGGRLGLVLPSGLATDHGSAALRRLLFSQCRVDALIGLDNHLGVFPIHRGVRFLLISASAGAPTERIACRLDLDDPGALESIVDDMSDAAYPVHVSPALLTHISGDDLAIPHLRSTIDVAIVERAAALFRPLGSAAGWAVRFGRELNASEDREAFRSPPTRSTGTGGSGWSTRVRALLPVVEGKHLEPFRVRVDAVRYGIRSGDARRLLPARRYEQPRLAYRDVASATNRLTLIAAVLPPHCASTHTVFCLRTPLSATSQHLLCGLFNSFVVNYLVRLRVTMHVTTATVEQLPIPAAETAPAACREIAALARLLSRRESPTALARLNARVAELYQLSAREFEYVLETFPLIPRDERDAALREFKTSTLR